MLNPGRSRTGNGAGRSRTISRTRTGDSLRRHRGDCVLRDRWAGLYPARRSAPLVGLPGFPIREGVNEQEGAPLAADAAAQDRISRDDPIVSERRCSPGRMSGNTSFPTPRRWMRPRSSATSTPPARNDAAAWRQSAAPAPLASCDSGATAGTSRSTRGRRSRVCFS